MHWQTEFPEKASWQVNLLGGLALMGVLLLGFGVDFKVYNARSHITGDEPGMRGYVIDRWGLKSLKTRSTPMVFPSRDYVTAPLTMRERAQRARYMSAALPPAPDGWSLRPITLDDILVLRPDWADCGLRAHTLQVGGVEDPSRQHCPRGMAWYDTWVYVQGDQRVAVWLRYDRDRSQLPFYCMPQVAPTFLTMYSFPRGGAGGAVLARTDGWTFRAPTQRDMASSGDIRSLPLRAYAEKRGDALVQVFAMTNASQSVLTGVLSAIDVALLDAMIAPPA